MLLRKGGITTMLGSTSAWAAGAATNWVIPNAKNALTLRDWRFQIVRRFTACLFASHLIFSVARQRSW
jgi:hypothetical protein